MLIVVIVLAIIIVLETVLLLRKKDTNGDLYKEIDKFSIGEYNIEKNIPDLIPGDNHLLKLKKGISHLGHFVKFINNFNIRTERSSSRMSNQVQKLLLNSSHISEYAYENANQNIKLNNDILEGSAAIDEIHASIENLNDQIVKQNNKVNENYNSIIQISNSIESIANTAKDRISDSEKLVQLTTEGSKKINQTNEFIITVKNSVEDVLKLNTVINSIASKTNLLSMNAAIEAAHAGEAGKGFSVVAEEIRKLATMTADNAKNISNTLKELDNNISKASDYSKSSGEAFKQIDLGVNNVSRTFEDITNKTADLYTNTMHIKDNINELVQISAFTKESMNEMKIGAKDISETFNNTKSLSLKFSDSIEELHKESKEINNVATMLTTSFFDINSELESMIKSISKFSTNSDSKLAGKIKLRNIIVSHINWFAKTRAFMDGTISVDGLDTDKQCELTSWLKIEGKNLLDSTSLDKLEKNHIEFHKQIKILVEQVKANNLNEALSIYKTLEDLSHNVISTLTAISQADFVTYSEEMSVGIDKFDEQHQTLFNIINKLSKAMTKGHADNVAVDLVQELVEYTQWHFKSEEEAFKEFNYPDKESHIAIHNKMVSTASEMLSDIKSGRKVLNTDILEFLQDWITNHIMVTDKEYSNFLKEKVL